MKRTANTSRAAHADVATTRATRGDEVLDGLQRYRAHHGADPTAYELLRWMQIRNPSFDLNAVRPRLTELKDAGRARTTGKRQCAVTEKRVHTWAAVTPAPRSILYSNQPRLGAAWQEALF